jgi:hypothetical protein
MTVRSFQDQVESLLTRKVAQQRTAGVLNPDAEASALLESLAFNLLVRPKTVLCFAHLARNALVRALSNEISLVDDLVSSIQDLGNPTYKITGSKHLTSAKNSLLQIESLSTVSTLGGAFKKFDQGIDDFLNKSVSRSVRRPGATEMARSADEARTDLAASYTSLKAAHADILQRLFALVVGVQNFLSVPLGAILGINTAYRARIDLEDLISSIENGTQGSTRDLVIRLIGNRAAVRAIGSPPQLYEPALDTAKELPAGYAVRGVSDPAKVVLQIPPGPYDLPAGTSLTINGITSTFPHQGLEIDNLPVLVSEDATYPVALPVNQFLFFHIEYFDSTPATNLRVEINGSSGPANKTLHQVVTTLNLNLAGIAEALEYFGSSSRFILKMTDSNIRRITLTGDYTEIGTTGLVNYFNNSCHELLGLSVGQSGAGGSVPASIVVDGLNGYYMVDAVQNVDGSITVSSQTDAPGTSLVISGASSLGLEGTHKTQSTSFRLVGKVLGNPTDPVAPDVLVDVGDFVTTPTGKSQIAAVSDTRITLSTAVPTFDGNVTVTSGLETAYKALDSRLRTWVESFLQTPFAHDLKSLDLSISALAGSATPSVRNNAVSAFQTALLPKLNELLGILTDAGTLLPPGAGSEEKKIVDGIIEALSEKKYDRAIDLLTKCQVQEFLLLDGQSASFAGDLMQSMSNLVRTDVAFPDSIQDQQDEGVSQAQSSEEDV